MKSEQTGQMCWLGVNSKSTKQLYLRRSPAEPWKPYSTFPFALPDYPIANGSKGYATYQALLKQGWKLLPSEEGERSISELVEQGWQLAG